VKAWAEVEMIANSNVSQMLNEAARLKRNDETGNPVGATPSRGLV